MPLYSHSKLATYENCPQQYKLKHIDRIELPEGKVGIEAFLGSRVHESLEKLYKELILTKLNTVDDLLQYYSSCWDKNWNKNVLIIKKGFTKKHYMNTGREAIAGYYKRYFPFNHSKTLATEYQLSFKIGDYTLRGFIDRLSCKGKGVYEIHDYKTSGSLPPQDKIDSERQLALYQIGIQDKFRDVKYVKLIWHYLIFDKEMISTRTPSQLRDLKKEIISLIRDIEKETKFEPVESNLCDWCDYPEYCPAKKHEFKLQTMQPNKYHKEKGVSLVNKYAAIKAKMKELKRLESALKLDLDLLADAAIEYAKREELSKIEGSDCSMSISSDTSLVFPLSGEEKRPELEVYIKKAGIWDKVSILNMHRVVQLVNDEILDARVRNQLLKFAHEVEKTSVRLLRKKSVED